MLISTKIGNFLVYPPNVEPEHQLDVIRTYLLPRQCVLRLSKTDDYMH